MSEALVPYEQRVGALTPADVRSQVNLIQHIMKDVMKQDEHYGVIPGTGSKPSLLKAGAEKLCLTFRLDPQYEITQEREGAHLTVTSKCTLFHIPSGQRFGSGMGSCSTKESKYAYRQAGVKCPECGKEAIIKGKDFKGDGKPTGWICFGKKGGCGSKFKDGDDRIESQPRGRVPNEDLADQYNTVLKMANKRSLIAAVLNATAASDIFTQDIEDMPQFSAKVIDPDITEEIPLNAAPQTSEAPSSSYASSGTSAGAAPTVTREAALKDLCSKKNVNYAELLKRAGVTHADEMTEEDFKEAKAMLERRKAA